MRIVVISPHADDETLGAGGLLLKNAAAGGESCWINVTNAKTEYGYSKEDETKGINETNKVAEYYGITEFYDLALEPAGLHRIDDSKLITTFSERINAFEPDTIVLPYPRDIHGDHRIVFNAAYSCTKTFRYPFLKRVLLMEIISETDNAVSDYGFVPNFFANIDDYLEKKIDIMRIYKNELGEVPFPRNEDAIRGLASYRGAACCCKYAEAFRCIKEIW